MTFPCISKSVNVVKADQSDGTWPVNEYTMKITGYIYYLYTIYIQSSLLIDRLRCSSLRSSFQLFGNTPLNILLDIFKFRKDTIVLHSCGKLPIFATNSCYRMHSTLSLGILPESWFEDKFIVVTHIMDRHDTGNIPT